jgi:hypothetical protein
VPHIFLLAFASAASLAPQLLAVVLVILTRPHPKPLLWAFWLTLLVVSCGSSFAILAVFRSNASVLGTTSRNVSPAAYFIVGAIALAVALFAATKRGRELLGREMDEAEKKKAQSQGKADPEGSIGERVKAKAEGVQTKAKEALKSGSVLVAILAGIVLGASTPFTLAAVGLMVRHGYRLPTQLLLIVAFSLITYLVVEAPIICYSVWPDTTTTRVEAFSSWLGTHKIQAVAAVVGVIGLVLIVKGFTA